MLVACLLLALAVPAALADEGTVMYVKTSKGGGIYVRSSMSAVDNSNVVGSLPYGSRVVTYGGNFNGWTMIDYADGGDYYVMYRYLVPDPPEPYVNPTQDDKNFSTKEASTIGQMNTLVANARYVTPYTITDEKDTISNLYLANGGKPLMSHRESIEALGWSSDVNKTLEDIREDAVADLMEPTM